MSSLLRINEAFVTIQGEALYTGVPSVFVRLMGCKVGCPWCDTKHTWTADPKDLVTIGAMVDKKHESPAYSEMTGGEPM